MLPARRAAILAVPVPPGLRSNAPLASFKHTHSRRRRCHWAISAATSMDLMSDAGSRRGGGPRIVFAAGGTGGHVYPAIAIADAIVEADPSVEVHFAGTAERMEGDAVPKAGYEFHPIAAVSVLRPLLSLSNLVLPFKLLGALWQCYQLLGILRPNVVVGTGGYISAPTCLAAALRGIPVVVQEQNAYAGLANRLIAKFAKLVVVAFPEAQKAFPKGKCRVLGNPVRKTLGAAHKGRARLFYEVSAEEAARVAGVPFDAWDSALRFITVMGGSLGATAINKAIEGAAADILAPGQRHILWQTGKGNFKEVAERVPRAGNMQVVSYLDRVDLAYAASDLVVARAGAITCSELLVTGTPSVLVPSPNVAEDHQTKNARAMEAAGAAVVLEESKLTPENLAIVVGELLADKGRLLDMRDRALLAATPTASDDIARAVLEVAESTRKRAAAAAA